MPRTHVKSNLDEQTIARALEDLSQIDKVFYDAYAHLRRTMQQSIKIYTTFRKQCDELISHRAALIRDISEIDPDTALRLKEGTDYAVPGVLFEEGDTLLSIKTAPKRLASPGSTQQSDDARSSRITPDRTAAKVPETKQTPIPPPPPRQLRRKRQLPVPSSPAIVAAVPQATNLTMKTDLVTKDHYWVFDFAAAPSDRDRTALYILRRALQAPAITPSSPNTPSVKGGPSDTSKAAELSLGTRKTSCVGKPA
ncbi:hypothetical protein PG993_011927 [Apiospora rasikravindrae]|uniref:Uncharacterized protein n=1 Tax=Apiospora rasikravindrae TaxID=990691 RepID=A0ABR1S0Z0_9PEZI